MNTPFLRFVPIPAAIADYLVPGLATIVLFVVAWVLDGWVKSNRGGKRFSHRNPLFVGLNRVVGRVARDLFKQVERRLINWSRSRLSYRRAAPLRWVGPELTIQNGIYELPSPLTYCANSTPEQREPSCIDLSLPVGTPGRSARSTLADNPSYARLTPDQRANYLQWMSTGRTHPLKHMNYAFLFFYGLERRLLIERNDLRAIIPEVIRLLETYTSSGSFDGYLTRFVAYTLVREPMESVSDQWFDQLFHQDRLDRDGQVLAVALAWLFLQNQPLSAEWALRIARLDPRTPRSVAFDRSPTEFATFFSKRYRDKFGEGLLLKASKRRRSVRYTPAHPLLSTPEAKRSLQAVTIPDVLGLPSQFAPIIAIWAESSEALKPPNRARSRASEIRDQVGDDILAGEIQPGIEASWQNLLAEKIAEKGVVLVPVRELAALAEIEPRKKLSTKQGETLAATAQAIGLAVEPDARTSRRLYGWYDWVALYPINDTHVELTRHPNYSAAALMLELGLIIANADGNVSDQEVEHIAHALESQYDLSPEDSRRLEALQVLLVRQPANLTVLSPKLVTALSPHERETLGAFLVQVAASDGSIEPKEATTLQKMFKVLELGPAVLERLIGQSRSISDEPVRVSPATDSVPGEAIPIDPARDASNLTFDEELLRRVLVETREVSRRLAEVMDQVEPEEEADEAAPASPAPPISSPNVRDPRFDGLDPRYHEVLNQLLTKPDWPRDEFATVVKSAGLMTSATLDILNEWSIETRDDPILEDLDDHLIVHSELISK